MMKRLLGWLGEWHLGHPSESRLLSLIHGELSGKPKDRTMRHLEACPSCRERMEQIRCEWSKLAEITSSVVLFPIMDEKELISGIRESINERGIPELTEDVAMSPAGLNRLSLRKKLMLLMRHIAGNGCL